ncbi:MAG: hypothetical protein R3B68_14520 [Phycisphaerales bacterium]
MEAIAAIIGVILAILIGWWLFVNAWAIISAILGVLVGVPVLGAVVLSVAGLALGKGR